MTKIIGICGISGAGKTTLAKALGKKLNATTLFWDHYDGISQSPVDFVKWFHSSQNYDEWKYDALAELLSELKAGGTAVCPVSGKKLKPTNPIIFDAPLGYCHHQTGRFLDRLIFLDTPLDIALARRILRDAQRLQEVFEELKDYLESSRPLFLGNDLRNQADFILNGGETQETLLEKTLSYINLFLQESDNYQVYSTAPNHFSSTVSVSGCFCEYNNKILFLKRAPEKIQGNCWGVPAGKAETGETPLQTLMREIKEEINISLDEKSIRSVGILYIALPHIHYTYHMYSYRFEELPEVQLNLMENRETSWLTIPEALQLPLVSGGKEALRF
jgi:uridine kinase